MNQPIVYGNIFSHRSQNMNSGLSQKTVKIFLLLHSLRETLQTFYKKWFSTQFIQFRHLTNGGPKLNQVAI